MTNITQAEKWQISHMPASLLERLAFTESLLHPERLKLDNWFSDLFAIIKIGIVIILHFLEEAYCYLLCKRHISQWSPVHNLLKLLRRDPSLARALVHPLDNLLPPLSLSSLSLSWSALLSLSFISILSTLSIISSHLCHNHHYHYHDLRRYLYLLSLSCPPSQ